VAGGRPRGAVRIRAEGSLGSVRPSGRRGRAEDDEPMRVCRAGGLQLTRTGSWHRSRHVFSCHASRPSRRSCRRTNMRPTRTLFEPRSASS
jgi:hypothetical protein